MKLQTKEREPAFPNTLTTGKKNMVMWKVNLFQNIEIIDVPKIPMRIRNEEMIWIQMNL